MQMSAAFVFFVMSTINIWTNGKHKSTVVLNKFNLKPQKIKPTQSSVATEPEK